VTRAAILLAALVACGDSGPSGLPDANPTVDAGPARETIAETQNLQPGEFVEGIMTGGHADVALIHLVAPMQLDWNIHSHASGHSVTVYEEYSKVTVDYHFAPSGDGDWYLLVRNSANITADIEVEVRLYGGMTWRWQ
jgi:predicted small lipoprotein YifL